MIGLGIALGDRSRGPGAGGPTVEGVPAVTEMPFDGYVFDAGQAATVTVPLSGTGDPDRDVEWRCAAPGFATPWTVVTADASGDWSADVEIAAANWGHWFTVEARYGAGGQVARGAAAFGCGTVVGFLGQSEITHFHALGDTYNPLPYPALAGDNLSVLLQDDASGAITARRIGVPDKTNVNLGLVALANALTHAGVARKIMVVDMNQPGTSRGELMDDADPERDFVHLASIVALVRSAGSDIGLVIENWYNADAASIETMGPSFAPWYFGQRWGGQAFTLGSANPDNAVDPARVCDHCLWDIEAAADSPGRGLFARDRTKLALMGPMPFHNTPVAPDAEWTNFTGNAPRMVEPVRDVIAAFAQDPRVASFCVGYGPSTHLCDFGGGIHPLPDQPMGSVQFALTHAPALLNWVGVTVSEPTIAGIETAPDGSFAEALVDLPNGGDLTTLRAVEGLAAPQTPAPHQQQATGFELSRAGGARRPVFASGQTAYPAAHRGTVTILDAGSGTPRRGRVRIVPDQPFGSGDQISYLLGQASANLLKPRDVDAALHLDMLIEHVPALHDGAAAHPFRGVPVRPHAVLPTIVLATPFVGRAAAFDGATNYASSTINQPAGSAGTMSFWFRNRDTAWNAKSSNRICQFRVNTDIVLELRIASSGRMTFALAQTGTGSSAFTPPSDTFTLNQWHHVAWSWDAALARFQVAVDGTALDTSGYTFGGGTLSMAGQNLTRMGIGGNVATANQMIGDIGHFWLDLAQSLDLSVAANLGRFLSAGQPVDLGPTGAAVTGSAPHYYYDGDGAAWANLGTAGNVPLNGSLTASDSVPQL